MILDNSSTHKTPKVQEWLNAVEGWFAQLERRSLHHGSFNSTDELRKEIKRFIKAHNEESKGGDKRPLTYETLFIFNKKAGISRQ